MRIEPTSQLLDFWSNFWGSVQRTLDFFESETKIENGIMSLDGFAELDDSKSLIINDEGWIEERNSDNLDFYLFVYKDDYYTALKAFYNLTGNVPLLPRYTLGNMWSRNWKYTQDEYIELIDRFKDEKLPFSVAIVDMDWHIVDVDEKYRNIMVLSLCGC